MRSSRAAPRPCTRATGSSPRTPTSRARSPRAARCGSARRPRRSRSWATRSRRGRRRRPPSVEAVPGTLDPIGDAERGRRVRRGVRLAGRDQGRVRRRRQGPEGRRPGPTTRRRRSTPRHREAQAYFGRSECYLERYLTRPAPHRDPGVRRHARQRGVAGRARLLDAASAPEADRGEPRARARRLASATRWARPR